MRPGESVRLTLPVPGGQNKVTIQTTTQRPGQAPGPTIERTFNLDYPTFIAGSRDSLILTVDRVR